MNDKLTLFLTPSKKLDFKVKGKANVNHKNSRAFKKFNISILFLVFCESLTAKSG